MISATHYEFRSVWWITAQLGDVCSVLADLGRYPQWWPEIRHVTDLGGGRFEVVARSLLPYELRFVNQGRADGRSGVLEAALSGDLAGTARWSIEPVGDSCRMVYDQEVDTHKRLLNLLAPVARPLFKANHALMMRHGEAGLRAFMAGHALGRSRARGG